MCHQVDFSNRLSASTPTLPLAELLLSKLQIVKINRKDVLDALILLAEHPLAGDDGAPDSRSGQGAISLPRILSYTSNDWGWWRTVTGNLDKLEQFLATEFTSRTSTSAGAKPRGATPRPQAQPPRPRAARPPSRHPINCSPCAAD